MPRMALLQIEATPREALTHMVYNVTFSLSARQIRERALAAFPGAEISFEPDLKQRLSIPGRRMWTTAPRAWTGAGRPPTTSTVPSTST